MPKPLNGHNSVTSNSNLMILVSIPRFFGARNTLKQLSISLSHLFTMKVILWSSAIYKKADERMHFSIELDSEHVIVLVHLLLLNIDLSIAL